MATIVILEHELQRHVAVPHMVRLLAERWRARGHRVLVHHGVENPPSGDVAILHVDLTVVPEAYRALVAHYPRVVNGKVFDISKSHFSQALVRPPTIWNGPVIVKTEANFGGRPEQLLRSVEAQTGARSKIPRGPLAEAYPIYESVRQVPEPVWRSPGLVVEKFLPEKDNRGYYLHVWKFLGDFEYCERWFARDPIVKGGNTLERMPIALPDEIRKWRVTLGFDYGKFDYVRSGGRWVLIDVNKTPAAPYPIDSPAARKNLEIADGINFFLR